MLHTLNSLPQSLLTHLGAFSRLDVLAQWLQMQSHLDVLRQHKTSDLHHINIGSHGLTLALQCLNPSALPEEQTWGLHSVTLKADTWKGGWPTGLNPHEATADEVVALFAPAPDEVVNMHPMLCFAVDGKAGQTWSVMAMFDPGSRKLSTFSLIRVGEWRALQPAGVAV